MKGDFQQVPRDKLSGLVGFRVRPSQCTPLWQVLPSVGANQRASSLLGCKLSIRAFFKSSFEVYSSRDGDGFMVQLLLPSGANSY